MAVKLTEEQEEERDLLNYPSERAVIRQVERYVRQEIRKAMVLRHKFFRQKREEED